MLDAGSLPMPLTYARILLRELGTSARLRARLLAGTGISEADLVDPAAEATLGAVLTLFDNASRACDPGWTLDVGRKFDLAAQGALGFAMVCAPTLAASFDTMARYGHVRAPWFRPQAFQERDRWGVKILRQFPVASHVDIAMVEAVVLSGQTLVETVLGRALTETVLSFDYPPPPWADCYRDAYHGRVVFSADYAGFSMPREWRDLPCPLVDAGMYQAAMSRLEMEKRRLDSGSPLSVRVAMLLAASGDAGLDLKTTAQRLNISPRTLIRRLDEAGTSFGRLLDAHRAERAAAMLANPGYSVSEVGYRLGYHEPANFTRAFKRWFGVTPTRYRSQPTLEE